MMSLKELTKDAVSSARNNRNNVSLTNHRTMPSSSSQQKLPLLDLRSPSQLKHWPTPKRSGKKMKSRAVHFHEPRDLCNIRMIPSRFSYTPTEKAMAWYTSTELRYIRAASHADGRTWLAGQQGDAQQNRGRDWRPRQTEFCHRGIECALDMEERRRRSIIRLRAETVVLMEQQRQIEQGIYRIPELIADLYIDSSNQATMDALQRGLSDATIIMKDRSNARHYNHHRQQQQPRDRKRAIHLRRGDGPSNDENAKQLKMPYYRTWTRPLFLDPSAQGMSC